jgi:hypothetical protein
LVSKANETLELLEEAFEKAKEKAKEASGLDTTVGETFKEYVDNLVRARERVLKLQKKIEDIGAGSGLEAELEEATKLLDESERSYQALVSYNSHAPGTSTNASIDDSWMNVDFRFEGGRRRVQQKVSVNGGVVQVTRNLSTDGKVEMERGIIRVDTDNSVGAVTDIVGAPYWENVLVRGKGTVDSTYLRHQEVSEIALMFPDRATAYTAQVALNQLLTRRPAVSGESKSSSISSSVADETRPSNPRNAAVKESSSSRDQNHFNPNDPAIQKALRIVQDPNRGDHEHYDKDLVEALAVLAPYLDENNSVEALKKKAEEAKREKEFDDLADAMSFLVPYLGEDHDHFESKPSVSHIVAVIEDPADGYANVRKGKSNDTPIVDKIQQGERFYAYPTSDSWWFVLTPRGPHGYVHKSKIRKASQGDTVVPDPQWKPD